MVRLVSRWRNFNSANFMVGRLNSTIIIKEKGGKNNVRII